MTTTPDFPDFRELCKELDALMIDLASTHPNLSENGVRIVNELSDRADAALATPPPEPPTDEELLALKEKLWDKYKTIPYQWEEFMYGDAFESALSDYRAILKRWG
jgi:hypothetical protein